MHRDCCIYRADFHRCTAKRDKKLHFFSPKKILQLQINAADHHVDAREALQCHEIDDLLLQFYRP